MLHLEDYKRIAKETDEWIDKYNKGLITKEEVLKMVDRMAIKMILSIESAIMKYIKDST